MRKRWWMFRPLDLIARYWPVFKPTNGILVIRMDGIGDMVLFRRSLDHYAEIFGTVKSEITILGCNSWGSLANEIFSDYKVISINEHAFARRPLYRLRISIMVRKIAPEVAVCDSYMRRALMADSLAWVSAAHRTIVSLPYISERTRPEFNYYLSQVDEIIDTGPYPTHEVIRHSHFISVLAGKTISPEAPFISWRETPEFNSNWNTFDQRYAVLNTGSNEPGRRWPMSDYAEIASNLIQLGLRVVFVGREDEQDEVNTISRLSKELGIVNLAGKTSLSQLLDLFAHAALVVSNDTGPAHLSIALGRPTVVIIGGGHFKSFVPYPDKVMPRDTRFVYQKMDCYHCFWRCHKRSDQLQTFPCISSINKDKVWHACKDLLGPSAEKKPGVL
jgi:ADP-heptose:LPS heptosyltransferase